MNVLLPSLLALASFHAWQMPDLDMLRHPMLNAYRQSTQAFRRVVHGLGLREPAVRLADLEQEAANSLLIVLGDTAILDQLSDGLGGFLRAGGAVLIATDRASAGAWQDELGVRVGDQFLYCKGKEGAIYQDHWVDCPLARPLGPLSDPLFHDADRVATNRPSYLAYEKPLLARLAGFPAGCMTVRSENPLEVEGRTPRHFLAAGGDLENGRILVIADHSIFINDMMLRDDLDNIRFAANCVTWLRGDVPRSRVLFVEEGVIQTNLEEALVPPFPPPEALVPLINEGLHGLQRENLFNRLLEPFWERILLGALTLLTLFLVGFGFLRLGRSRFRMTPASPRLATLLSRQATSAAVIELRHRAMLEEGNLWEAARALARQCFDGAFRETAAVALSRLAAEWGEPPQVHVSGGWWRRWQLGKQVRRLWQLAYDPVPVPVSAREFTHLAHEARAVRAALADGTVRIEPP